MADSTPTTPLSPWGGSSEREASRRYCQSLCLSIERGDPQAVANHFSPNAELDGPFRTVVNMGNPDDVAAWLKPIFSTTAAGENGISDPFSPPIRMHTRRMFYDDEQDVAAVEFIARIRLTAAVTTSPHPTGVTQEEEEARTTRAEPLRSPCSVTWEAFPAIVEWYRQLKTSGASDDAITAITSSSYLQVLGILVIVFEGRKVASSPFSTVNEGSASLGSKSAGSDHHHHHSDDGVWGGKGSRQHSAPSTPLVRSRTAVKASLRLDFHRSTIIDSLIEDFPAETWKRPSFHPPTTAVAPDGSATTTTAGGSAAAAPHLAPSSVPPQAAAAGHATTTTTRTSVAAAAQRLADAWNSANPDQVRHVVHPKVVICPPWEVRVGVDAFHTAATNFLRDFTDINVVPDRIIYDTHKPNMAVVMQRFGCTRRTTPDRPGVDRDIAVMEVGSMPEAIDESSSSSLPLVITYWRNYFDSTASVQEGYFPRVAGSRSLQAT